MEVPRVFLLLDVGRVFSGDLEVARVQLEGAAESGEVGLALVEIFKDWLGLWGLAVKFLDFGLVEEDDGFYFL